MIMKKSLYDKANVCFKESNTPRSAQNDASSGSLIRTTGRIIAHRAMLLDYYNHTKVEVASEWKKTLKGTQWSRIHGPKLCGMPDVSAPLLTPDPATSITGTCSRRNRSRDVTRPHLV